VAFGHFKICATLETRFDASQQSRRPVVIFWPKARPEWRQTRVLLSDERRRTERNRRVFRLRNCVIRETAWRGTTDGARLSLVKHARAQSAKDVTKMKQARVVVK